MLLYDRLRAQIPVLPTGIPILDATTIQQRIDKLPDDTPQATAADYGTVAPPFPHFFVEATSLSTLPEEAGQLVQRGVLFHTWDITAAGFPPRYRQINQRPGAAWLLIGWGYIHHLGVTYGTPSCFILQIDRSGNLLDDTNAIQVAIDPPVYGQLLPPTPPTTIATMIPFALTAVSALHRRCEAERITPTRQQRRQAERKGQPAPSDHYVIHVRPGAVRNVSDIARRPQPAPGTRADYGARGHFKYYHPDRPRFGRPGEHGLFWINPRTGKDDPIANMQRVYQIEDYR